MVAGPEEGDWVVTLDDLLRVLVADASALLEVMATDGRSSGRTE